MADKPTDKPSLEDTLRHQIHTLEKANDIACEIVGMHRVTVDQKLLATVRANALAINTLVQTIDRME